MELHGSNCRQNLSLPQASTSSSVSSKRRHRLSFRGLFWKRTSANYDGKDDVVREPEVNPSKKTPYVPVNAASGFSKTASTPREQSGRRNRLNDQSSNRGSGIDIHTRLPLNGLAVGHLYVHTESEPDTTDFTAFIAAAQTDERLLHAEPQKQKARSHYRDSGYYSCSKGCRCDYEPYSPSLPSAASATGATRLKAQPSRRFGRRIADYIKPPQEKSAPLIHQ